MALLCLLLFLTAGIFFGNSYFSQIDFSFFILSAFIITYQPIPYSRFYLTILMLFIFLFYALFQLPSLYLLGYEIGLVLYLIWLQRNSLHNLNFDIFLLTFILHLFYIQLTPIDVRQHDLNGILLYTKEISSNFINFNPWNMYYFFHQPLHFLVISVFYNCAMWLWNSSTLAADNLQYISLFFVTASSIFLLKIINLLNLDKKTSLITTIFLLFSPTLFLFSGYISNDVSVFFWCCATIYFALSWFISSQRSFIILTAICFALGVLTKLSALMLVPALTFLFLYKIFHSSDKYKTIIDIDYFIIFAVPLALIWIVRNHIIYDMSFYNIPDTSPNGQNFYYISFLNRILDFSKFLSPFIHAPLIADNNIWLAIIKTELFGEWNLSLNNRLIFYPALILYFLNITLKICVFFALVYHCFNIALKKSNVSPLWMFFAILYITLWGNIFKYAMDYPYICSSDFRLFALLMIPEYILLAFFINKANFSKIKAQIIQNLVGFLAIIYALLSSLIYILVI